MGFLQEFPIPGFEQEVRGRTEEMAENGGFWRKMAGDVGQNQEISNRHFDKIDPLLVGMSKG